MASPAVGPLFSFCLWLRPAPAASEHFAGVISSLAAKHDSPCFSPHVTLLVAAAETEEAETDALGWLSDVAGAAKGKLLLEMGDAAVSCLFQCAACAC